MMLVTRHVHYVPGCRKLILKWLVRQRSCVVAEISHKSLASRVISKDIVETISNVHLTLSIHMKLIKVHLLLQDPQSSLIVRPE